MRRETDIHGSMKRLGAALVLASTMLSFTLPREFFDPHNGTHWDIFCVTMNLSFQSDSVVGAVLRDVLFVVIRGGVCAHANTPLCIHREKSADTVRAPPLYSSMS
ncbi:MAG: hypothetical protein JXA20_13225 [Spirochaetes bacterium]|nr:hypothetical protein [Spirochaetota bacterium]